MKAIAIIQDEHRVASNEDPVVGVPASESLRELFKRIVTIAPPPWGVGPEARR